MAALNELQKKILEQYDSYRVVMQFTTGELMIAPGRNYRYAKVIDTAGQVYGYLEYMSTRDHRRRSEHSTQPPKNSPTNSQT